jgi:hypothetical protein
MNPTPTPIIIPPNSPESFDFGGLGVEWKINGASTSGHFSVVHHPMAPRALAAPLHLHHREEFDVFVAPVLLGDQEQRLLPLAITSKPTEEVASACS